METYCHIRCELQSLSALEWKALKRVLRSDKMLAASTVEVSEQERRLVDPLLRMGVVIQGSDGTLRVVSELMYRVCVEALPA
uniref:Uncharacterized protein n=1 Tax=Globisporangium ultimum (strain ATCC 200006 / CBS 805.95 / DAOM BR144) TaxID=431595 RepID=K3WIH5_GLOUD